jgi:hypothetical protein
MMLTHAASIRDVILFPLLRPASLAGTAKVDTTGTSGKLTHTKAGQS